MLFRNTLAQSSSKLLGYAFSFILAPIMLARLGLEAFGVWAVTGALATYAGVLDLGIGRSLSRFVAIYDAEGDERRIRECVGLGLTAVALVGAVAAAVAALAAPLLSRELGVLSSGEMRAVVVASVSIWTFNGVSGALQAVGIGKRQMVPPNIALATGLTLNFVLSVVALVASSSLVVYALANAAAAVLAVVPAFAAMAYVWTRPFVAVPSRALVREVLSFGVKNQVGWIADLVNTQADKVIIALMIDVRTVAVYEIAARVVQAVRSTSILTVSAIIPTAAAETARRGRGVVGEMYSRYTLRSSAIAFPLFMLASVAAPFLLVAWLGRAPGDSELLVPFLTAAYLVNITTGVGSTIAIGAGSPGMVSVNLVLVAALNVALTIALAPWFGLWGVVTATFVAIAAGSVLFTARFLRLFELPWRDFLAGVWPPGALAVGLALPFAALAAVVGVPGDRVTAAALLALVTAGYALPYWALASAYGLLPERLRLRRPRARQSADVA